MIKAINYIWVIERLYNNDSWFAEEFYFQRKCARKSCRDLKLDWPNCKFRISKFVRETPIHVEQTKLKDFIKSVEKAQEVTRKSKLRFP